MDGDQAVPATVTAALQQHLDELLEARQYPKTICPSEVPRALSQSELEQAGVAGWRDLMPAVRSLVWTMMQDGRADVLQGGQPLDHGVRLEDVKGPIRVRKRSAIQ